MAGRTHSLLRTLAHPERLAVLAELAEGEGLTHADLLERLRPITKVVLSKALRELDESGLVTRPQTNRAQWKAVSPIETRRLIAAAADLATTLGELDASADRRLAERMNVEE